MSLCLSFTHSCLFFNYFLRPYYVTRLKLGIRVQRQSRQGPTPNTAPSNARKPHQDRHTPHTGKRGPVTDGPRASVSASGAGKTARSWVFFTTGRPPPIRAATKPGCGGARPQNWQPQPRSSGTSPLLCTASGGRCFKLCILLMELVLKSNPQCNRVSQTRLYFTGTRRRQREHGVEAQRAWDGAAAGGWDCSCLQVRPVCLQGLLRPLQSPNPRPRLSNVAAG